MQDPVNAPVIEEPKGTFYGSLIRNNTKIRKDRAAAIQEAAQMTYKREVEDIEIKIKQLRRERENMLDMSPENVTSLVLASDFKEKEFVAKDISIGIALRELEIKHEIAARRYALLFTEVR